MVDINPRETISKFTPRDTNLVDALAEAKRIAEQQMRSNPLKDAQIDSGLTRWVGNYGGDLVWIGEFLPPDHNQFDQYGNMRPQRGVSIVRDDPQHKAAFSMYDFDPRTGVPLRQRVYIHDADGNKLMMEGYTGGRAFPDHPIPMYARVNIEAGLSNGSDDIIWGGSSNIVGNNLQFQGIISSSGTVGTTYFIRAAANNGVNVDSPTRVVSGSVNVSEQLDLTAVRLAGADFADVQWHMFRSSGTGLYFPHPSRVRTFSDFTG